MDNDRYYQLGSHDKLFNQIDELTDALAIRDAEVAELKTKVVEAESSERVAHNLFANRIIECDQLREQVKMHKRAIDALVKFGTTVAPSSSFWDEVWPVHEEALADTEPKEQWK